LLQQDARAVRRNAALAQTVRRGGREFALRARRRAFSSQHPMKNFLPSPGRAALVLALLATAACTTVPPTDPALLNPATNSAIRAEPRDANWVKRHEGFVAIAQKGGVDVLFLGDSITDFWRNRGQAIWEKEYAPLHAANFGISGDRTQHVLWRMAHGELDGLAPKVVVLLIGTNNTGVENNGAPRNTNAEVIVGVTQIVSMLRTKLPSAKILLLAIFPRADSKGPPAGAPDIKAINAALAKLDDGRAIRFLDFGAKFLAADGKLSKELFPDLLHPNAAGYAIWADAIRAPLAEMLK
jgi:lysophospholipase L1-like esterase